MKVLMLYPKCTTRRERVPTRHNFPLRRRTQNTGYLNRILPKTMCASYKLVDTAVWLANRQLLYL